jgi:hypothetical protein
MIIVNSFFYPCSPERNRDIKLSILSNLALEFVKEIHLFISFNDLKLFKEDMDYVDNINIGKVRFLISEIQPTYSMLFTYGSNLKDEICCICNTDIELQITERNTYLFYKYLTGSKTIFFLTRHESDGTRPLIDGFCGSHDAFIFHSDTLRETLAAADLSKLDHVQNTHGIEAIMTIYFIEELRYMIYNPCIQLKIVHHHLSNIRDWRKDRPIAVGYTSPNKLELDGVHCSYMLYPLILQ